MEMHHKLRRDPNWHPSGCNICGQLGHQAAQCTTGTVNWRAMYGEDAFDMRPAIFQSDIEADKKAKQVDFEDLKRRAEDYAKMRAEGGAPPQLAPPQGSQPQGQQQPPQQQLPPQQQAVGGAPPKEDPAAAEAAARKRAAEDGLPEGWAVAFDAAKKPYFYHRTTRKTLWEKPNAATPIN